MCYNDTYSLACKTFSLVGTCSCEAICTCHYRYTRFNFMHCLYWECLVPDMTGLIWVSLSRVLPCRCTLHSQFQAWGISDRPLSSVCWSGSVFGMSGQPTISVSSMYTSRFVPIYSILHITVSFGSFGCLMLGTVLIVMCTIQWQFSFTDVSTSVAWGLQCWCNAHRICGWPRHFKAPAYI